MSTRALRHAFTHTCMRTLAQVLDVARQHAQLLDAAATELFQAHMRRQPDACPLLDVYTALEVLTTGEEGKGED